MIALYQTAVALCLLLMSFVHLPFPFPGRDILDINAVFVLYLAYFRPVREGAVFTCALGLVMDSLSAGPFGLHFVVYLFLFTVFRLAPRYLQVKNPLLLGLSAALAAGIQELALAVPALAAGAGPGALASFGRRLLAGSLWAGLIGWPLLTALRLGNDRIAAWQEARR